MTDAKLRLATWNIHMGIGQDSRRDLVRTATVIREMTPDLIGLQEVDNCHSKSGSDLEKLAAWTGLEVVAGPTMQRSSGDYGNALFTRLPVVDVERYDLSVKQREPRGLLIAHLDWQEERLQVAVTHLGLRAGERREQVRRLVEHLSTPDRTPLILMGDFNEWFVWGRPRRRLERRFHQLRSPATFPSRRPVFGLDHILADPPERLGDRLVFKSELARIASDHLPLMATFSR